MSHTTIFEVFDIEPEDVRSVQAPRCTIVVRAMGYGLTGLVESEMTSLLSGEKSFQSIGRIKLVFVPFAEGHINKYPLELGETPKSFYQLLLAANAV
ncbi:MAG: hypothetical protein IPL46_28090 [Saprospiraceae bacterium]|nr:hypothetical protein [Saprospiraceae bacterium]